METEYKSENEMKEVPIAVSENLVTENNEAVIYDECGDSLWDAVLAQDEKTNVIHRAFAEQPADDLISQIKK